MDDFSPYALVEGKVDHFKKELLRLIADEKKKNGKIIAVGAPARGVVILNTCKIGPDDIEFVVDDTVLKQGKVMPGVHIPVTSWDSIPAQPKRTFLVLSWNYKEHLIFQLKTKVKDANVIIPFPQLRVTPLGDA
jgi:C-methyltransferase C-terminal domain